jgi:hypothetical protein
VRVPRRKFRRILLVRRRSQHLGLSDMGTIRESTGRGSRNSVERRRKKRRIGEPDGSHLHRLWLKLVLVLRNSVVLLLLLKVRLCVR